MLVIKNLPDDARDVRVMVSIAREAGGGIGMGTHVNPWLIHVSVWQKPLHYCKVISLQLIKINEKKKESWFPSLGQEDPLEEEMATYPSILAWRNHRQEPGGLQSMGSQRETTEAT